MKKTIICLLSLIMALPALAQDTERKSLAERSAAKTPDPAKDTDRNLLAAALKGWHVSVGAGLNMGGMSPVPLPRSIRSLDSFNPLLNLSIEGMAHKKFDKHWGMDVGLRFETKGMKTEATVKNYHMKITENANGGVQTMEGGWTGKVVTRVHDIYLTIPVLATYTFRNERWTVNAGPYFGFLLNGDFEGHVHDGYLRTSGNPEGVAPADRIPDELGENVDVTYATYDFGSDQRTFAWGLQVGGSFRAYKHLYVNAHLDWGLNSIFPDDFKTITFKMYPIYGNLGFSYLF